MAKKTRETCEKEHDFTLVLIGVNDLTTKVETSLFESGCDDATLSMRCGRAYLSFSRTAPSFKDAVLSAIRDVRKAGFDVLRVDCCDLVTQAEIARRVGRKRQQIHQFVTGERGPGGFPAPIFHMADESPMWAWREAAYWLWQNNMIREEVVQEASEAAVINLALELKQQTKLFPDLTTEVLQLVKS